MHGSEDSQNETSLNFSKFYISILMAPGYDTHPTPINAKVSSTQCSLFVSFLDVTGCIFSIDSCIPYDMGCDLQKPKCCGKIVCVNDNRFLFYFKTGVAAFIADA